MKIVVELTPIERFEVKIGGRSLGEFEKESSWEGLSKLRGSGGHIIIEDSGPTIVENMFKGRLPEEPQKHTVVLITPELMIEEPK